MIRRLQKKFIRISMLSVMLVMLTLCIIVNAANFISVDSGIKVMLDLISDNRGAIPSPSRPQAGPAQDPPALSHRRRRIPRVSLCCVLTAMALCLRPI